MRFKQRFVEAGPLATVIIADTIGRDDGPGLQCWGTRSAGFAFFRSRTMRSLRVIYSGHNAIDARYLWETDEELIKSPRIHLQRQLQ